MYTKVLTVLFLYVYVAGEDGGYNQSEDYPKENIKPFSNYSSEPEVPSQHTRRGNERKGVIRRTYDSNIFKLLSPMQEDDDSSEFKVNSDIQQNGHAGSELQVPMFSISINNRTKNRAVSRNENDSSELIQADGTYNMQQYVRPPFMDNQYAMQYSPSYSNWEQTHNGYNSRIDPCVSSSVSHQYMQQNYGRRSYSEYDPYQAQGTYNVQSYMPSYQQRKQISIEHQRQVALNNWRRLNYKNQASSVNPCLPNPPNLPSVDRRHIPNPPKPPNIYSLPEQNIFPYDTPPSNIRGHIFSPLQTYRDTFPSQNGNNFEIYPPQSFIDSHLSHRIPLTGRMNGYFTPPHYAVKRPVHTQTPGSRTKSFTPTWPKVTPPPYSPTWPKVTPPPYSPSWPKVTPPPYSPSWPKVTPPPYSPSWPKVTPPIYTPTRSSRTKSYTPPSWRTTPKHYTPPGKKTTPRYTPPGRKTTPTHYTPPGKKTTPKGYTPPGRKTTPTHYTPPGKKTTPTHYTPPGCKTTPTHYTPPGWRTTPTRYTPPGWKTPPPTRSRTKSHTW